jgi:hypothetical protein
MKNLIILSLIFLLSCYRLTAQNNSIINIYNLEKRDIEVSILLNDKEIASIKKKSKLKYSLSTSGEIKLKFEAFIIFRGSKYPAATPTVKTIKLEKGKTYNFGTKVGLAGIFTVKDLSEKEIEKLNKSKFSEIVKSE